MNVLITPREHELLTELVDERIRDLGPEIRRSRTSRFHDELKQQLEDIKAIKRKLHESAYDVKA